MGSPQSTGAA